MKMEITIGKVESKILFSFESFVVQPEQKYCHLLNKHLKNSNALGFKPRGITSNQDTESAALYVHTFNVDTLTI